MDYKTKLLLSILLLIGCTLSISAQNSIYQNHSYRPFDRYVYNSENRFHTSIKPYNMQEVNKIVSLDTLYVFETKNKWVDKIMNKSILSKKTENYSITVRPACDFEISKQIGDTTSGWVNTRGFVIDGNITQKVFFKTSFYESQSRLFDYRRDRINELGRVVPGAGKPKSFGEYKDGLDYAFSDAYVMYTPSKYFDFQLGHGKHFIGDGYRSLLLSDNSFNYPYFKLGANVGNLKYITMWSQHAYWPNGWQGNERHDIKWNVMHYLDWAITDWLTIGLFETIIWADQDSINGNRGFEWQYLNPVIFFRPVEFSIGSPDNVIMGATGKITLWKKHIFYGQVVIDEFNVQEFKKRSAWWGTKFGLQAGYKTHDIGGIENLDFQTEVNYVRPFMYSHFHEGQNYGHYNQPLAHPMGSNFIESITFLRYSYKRFFAEAKFTYALHGQDTTDVSFGNDIFKLYTTRTQEYGHKITQLNVQNTVIYTDLRLSYMINPRNNLNVSVGVTNRYQHSEIAESNELMWYFGLRTTLNNHYYDF